MNFHRINNSLQDAQKRISRILARHPEYANAEAAIFPDHNGNITYIYKNVPKYPDPDILPLLELNASISAILSRDIQDPNFIFATGERIGRLFS